MCVCGLVWRNSWAQSVMMLGGVLTWQKYSSDSPCLWIACLGQLQVPYIFPAPSVGTGGFYSAYMHAYGTLEYFTLITGRAIATYSELYPNYNKEPRRGNRLQNVAHMLCKIVRRGA